MISNNLFLFLLRIPSGMGRKPCFPSAEPSSEIPIWQKNNRVLFVFFVLPLVLLLSPVCFGHERADSVSTCAFETHFFGFLWILSFRSGFADVFSDSYDKKIGSTWFKTCTLTLIFWGYGV
jgi:hypothetical protein